jgi:2-isopropylmalate synthase
MRERITIFDTTLRDGEQAPGFSMRESEKLRLARALDELGVDVVEVGFPIASDSDFEAVRAVSREVRRPAIAALARCAPQDIDRACAALEGAARPRLHTFIATSDLHLEKKLRMTREECLDAAAKAVERARRSVDDVEFSAEDATRSDLDFLASVVKAVMEAGATTINLPDTVGYALPHEITGFFRSIIGRVPNAHRVTFSAHCHNDLGLAVANSLAALEGGVRQVECTINGIGERAGNASLEEIVMAVKVRPDLLAYETGIRTPGLLAASQLLCEVTGEPVQANKAIVGRNAFAHEAGIHQDGLLKDRRTYEIMRPEDVGVPETTFVLGKHSGRHALKNRCQALQVSLSRLELDEVYKRMIRRADTRKVIRDADVLELVAEIKRAEALRHAPGAFRVARTDGGDRTSEPAWREETAIEEPGYGYGV